MGSKKKSADFKRAMWENLNAKNDFKAILFNIFFRKRYDKAESEFVSAKLHLRETEDKKELLTEHLCLIIQKTEERKAEKLEKIMKELNLDGTGEVEQEHAASTSRASSAEPQLDGEKATPTKSEIQEN